MIIGYTKKFNLTLEWQMKTQVGILSGIGLNLVNLLYIKKVNIMIGIAIVGIKLMKKKDPQKERLENYL